MDVTLRPTSNSTVTFTKAQHLDAPVQDLSTWPFPAGACASKKSRTWISQYIDKLGLLRGSIQKLLNNLSVDVSIILNLFIIPSPSMGLTYFSP